MCDGPDRDLFAEMGEDQVDVAIEGAKLLEGHEISARAEVGFARRPLWSVWAAGAHDMFTCRTSRSRWNGVHYGSLPMSHHEIQMMLIGRAGTPVGAARGISADGDLVVLKSQTNAEAVIAPCTPP